MSNFPFVRIEEKIILRISMINKKIFQQELEDWDKNAQFYIEKNALPYYGFINEKLIKFYELKENEKILEAGGATGLITGSNVTIVDFSPKMIEVAKKLNPQGNFIISSVHKMPVPDKEFDVIIADDLFHHVKAQELLEATAEEFKRVLKDDGRLCVFERNSSILPRLFFYLRQPIKKMVKTKNQCSSRNESIFSKKDLEKILKCGFEIQRRKYMFALPFQALTILTNVIQYLFSNKTSRHIQEKTIKFAIFLETKLNYKFLCAQQCLILIKSAHKK